MVSAVDRSPSSSRVSGGVTLGASAETAFRAGGVSWRTSPPATEPSCHGAVALAIVRRRGYLAQPVWVLEAGDHRRQCRRSARGGRAHRGAASVRRRRASAEPHATGSEGWPVALRVRRARRWRVAPSRARAQLLQALTKEARAASARSAAPRCARGDGEKKWRRSSPKREPPPTDQASVAVTRRSS